ADPDGPGVRLLVPDDHLHQGGLAYAVGANHADDAALGEGEAQVLDQDPVTEALGQPGDLDHLGAQPRARRDLDLLEVELAARVGLGGHLLVALQPGPALGLAGPRVRPDPFELVLQALAPLGVLGALDLEPAGL